MNKLLLISLTLTAFVVSCNKNAQSEASSQAECQADKNKKWVEDKCEDRVYYTVSIKGGNELGKENGQKNHWPPHANVNIRTTKDHHWNTLSQHGDCVKVEDVYFQDGATVTVTVSSLTTVLEASHYEVVYDYPTGEDAPELPTATDYVKVNKVDTANTAQNCVHIQEDIQHPVVTTPPAADGTTPAPAAGTTTPPATQQTPPASTTPSGTN